MSKLTYRVYVIDRITRRFHKDFVADSIEDATRQAEEDTWTPEGGWKEDTNSEVITDCYIDYVEPPEWTEEQE
jgi:hypothetical protein